MYPWFSSYAVYVMKIGGFEFYADFPNAPFLFKIIPYFFYKSRIQIIYPDTVVKLLLICATKYNLSVIYTIQYSY